MPAIQRVQYERCEDKLINLKILPSCFSLISLRFVYYFSDVTTRMTSHTNVFLQSCEIAGVSTVAKFFHGSRRSARGEIRSWTNSLISPVHFSPGKWRFSYLSSVPNPHTPLAPLKLRTAGRRNCESNSLRLSGEDLDKVKKCTDGRGRIRAKGIRVTTLLVREYKLAPSTRKNITHT